MRRQPGDGGGGGSGGHLGHGSLSHTLSGPHFGIHQVGS